MNVSTRFTIALHVLTLLASLPEEPLTSEFIAGSINTNPAFVRRLMAMLRKADMVTSQPGQGGGWLMTANPRRLTLADVRRAVDEASPFAMHAAKPNPKCPVGRNIQAALAPIYCHAERIMVQDLQRTTIASLLDSVQHHK